MSYHSTKLSYIVFNVQQQYGQIPLEKIVTELLDGNPIMFIIEHADKTHHAMVMVGFKWRKDGISIIYNDPNMAVRNMYEYDQITMWNQYSGYDISSLWTDTFTVERKER